MLAVQRIPKMGSPEPESDPPLPFGYSFETNHESQFDAPEPASLGAPILSETDNKFLSSFFEDINAEQYNMPLSFGEGLQFSDSWLDLPPQFIASTTSFRPQASTSLGPEPPQSYHGGHSGFQGLFSGSNLMSLPAPAPPPPPPTSLPPLSFTLPPQHQHQQQQRRQPQQPPNNFFQGPSDDVLNAAATLVQNGSRIVAKRSNDAALRSSSDPSAIGPSVGHIRHQPLEEFKEGSQRDMAHEHHDNIFSEWIWGPKDRRPTQSVATTDYQWGSDFNFGTTQGYNSERNQEAANSMQQDQLKCLDCLKPSTSATPTALGSPATHSHHPSISTMNNWELLPLASYGTNEGEGPPRKRRKSKAKNQADAGDEAVEEPEEEEEEEEEDEEGLYAAKTTARRRRKLTSERRASTSASPKDLGGAAKRRKSAALGIKPPRENLSEEQKRKNHIKSEQKRRTLIKVGFDDLCELVPGLKGGGFSKSTMLGMTAEWLEGLLKGNEALEQRLSRLGSPEKR